MEKTRNLSLFMPKIHRKKLIADAVMLHVSASHDTHLCLKPDPAVCPCYIELINEQQVQLPGFLIC